MWRKWIATALLLAVGGLAQAAEVGGVRVDDKATVGGQDLVLNGAGVRSKAIFKVYVASLYLPAKADDLNAVLAKSPRRIRMDILRNLTADQMVDALVEGLNDNNSSAELAAVKNETADLVATMKSFRELKEKDVVTLDFVDGFTRIALNGAERGAIKGEAFNKALTRIWLGDKPAQSDLKRALLGG